MSVLLSYCIRYTVKEVLCLCFSHTAYVTQLRSSVSVLLSNCIRYTVKEFYVCASLILHTLHERFLLNITLTKLLKHQTITNASLL